MQDRIYYVVFVGRKCGVYNNEIDAIAAVQYYQDGWYGKYNSHEDALAALDTFFVEQPDADKESGFCFTQENL